MRGPKWVIYQDSASQWRWRLVAANGKIVAQGECHPRKADAIRACDTVRRTAIAAVKE